ncbi:nucleotidyl transferase AbiEii/AbiGii toxin family protein [Bradyrhizobium pachyrhizi]|uniref:nucleotidyl transferase AbiEii/AbiGii toxin family protein n=1 Tax=Bradyrhizobium pachyrhizi TaxID=280333 RepID=UPI000AB75B85|nr:nucleotidyl transferase AbiEii/AbiGii toxin family protein [Bradyrhizobium pachyrhizi]
MPRDFLHNHPQFGDLIRIVAEEKGIDPALVEKDYWIMHCLHGLQQFGFTFQLKGGTSLSKGHGIIGRFSEDIDILIEPPAERDVKTGKNHDKPAHIQSRKDFYDWLAQSIKIDGIATVERDADFDDIPKYRSAGIKLTFPSTVEAMEGLRDGVLPEVGFDTVAPNEPRDISSWVYDYAAGKVEVIDNRAKAVPSYDPRYTFEKLQTVATKLRHQQADGSDPIETFTNCFNATMFEPSLAPRPTTSTRMIAFRKRTTRISPQTRPSPRATPRRARSMPTPASAAAPCTMRASRASTRSWRRSEIGSASFSSSVIREAETHF